MSTFSTLVVSRFMRIIIVDDHPIIYECLPIALQDEPDIEVVGSYGSSTEALRVVMESPPDVLILDLCMPEMDGIALVNAITSHPELRDIPIVIVSTEGSSARIEELRKKGIKGYLRKPFTPENIRDIIVSTLGEWHE